MKRIIFLLLIAFSFVVCPGIYGAENYENPFNNELFTVIAEAETPGGIINVDFSGVRIVPSADAKSFKAVAHKIDYKGKLTQWDLCDFTSLEEARGIMNNYDNASSKVLTFNDGLEPFSDGYGFYGYRNIDKKPVHGIDENLAVSYDYNIGLIRECDGKTTTFTAVMTDNSSYSFLAKINCFNDDGYSIMKKDGKYYVIKLKNGIIPTVFYNDKKIAFDRIPVIENGRTLVPLRAIFETFGATVGWNQETKTVTSTMNGITITLTVGETKAYKNNKTIILDVPAKVENGRTLVPVRFIADCFGIDVGWNQEMKKVSLKAVAFATSSI